MPQLRPGCVSLVSEQKFGSHAFLICVISPNNFLSLMSESCHLVERQFVHYETNFPDFGQLGEAITSTIQSTIRHPQMTTLETVSHLQINNFFGNEGPEKSDA